MGKHEDPDGIGWNYHIYRSSKGGCFITDIGGGATDASPTTSNERLARFQHVDGGFIIKVDGEEIARISRDAIRSMEKIQRDREAAKFGRFAR